MIKRYLVNQLNGEYELLYIIGFGVLAIGLIYLIDFIYKKFRAKGPSVHSTDKPRNLP